MELSVVIPVWSGTDELVEMTLDLAKQIRPMCDELIITEDGEYSKALDAIADTYLVHPRLGHALNLALGVKVASGKYVAVLDSDIIIVKGSLRDLCIPSKFVCGKWLEAQGVPMSTANLNIQKLPNDGPKAFWGWCFVADGALLIDPRFSLPDAYRSPSSEAHQTSGLGMLHTAPNEGIDEWTVHINKTAPYEWTDKMEYIHLRTRSYEARSEAIRIARENAE